MREEDRELREISYDSTNIAVLIPCYNEEEAIGSVIQEFRAQLPDAAIYVFDNNSTDNTVKIAKEAGAEVYFERRQGKGNVVFSMFREINADIYVMVDGDGTYPPDKVHDLIRPIITGDADMVNGSRLHDQSDSQFKRLNHIGNRLFLSIVNLLFKIRIADLLTGYRVFARHVVKSLPIISRGFEIETELTLKCIERRYRVVEIPVNLSPRAEGGKSKIRIVRDGLLIFNTIFALFRDYKPLTAFGFPGLSIILLGLVLGSVVIVEFILTGEVLRVPLAILSVGAVLSGLLVLFVGLVLHTISRRFQELDYQLRNISESIYMKTDKRDE